MSEIIMILLLIAIVSMIPRGILVAKEFVVEEHKTPSIKQVRADKGAVVDLNPDIDEAFELLGNEIKDILVKYM